MRIGVVPDPQCKPGVRLNHLTWASRYFADKDVDCVVNLGDHWDMPSLSSYDKGKRAAEGRRVDQDIAAGNKGLELLSEHLPDLCRKILLRGNHEQRLERYTEDNAELDGSVGYHQFNDKALGWEVYPFLEPVTVAGVTFCHYFPRSSDGNVSQTKRGAPSAMAQLKREMRSCVAGHRQGLDLAIHTNGQRMLRSIIAGSFYQHDEGYLSPQGNSHWRGILMLTEVKQGNFNLVEVSLDYLRKRYS